MTRTTRSLLSPLLISLLLGGGGRVVHANTGNKFCACLPSTFVFTFDFSLGCTDDISSDDPGISDFTCKISTEGGEAPSDPVPIVVTGIQIIEIGQPTRSQILKSTTETGQDYKDGDTFEYTSTADVSFPISDDAPKTLQVLMTGVNANGEALLNLWTIEFTNQCDVFPVLTPGMQAGWMVMTKLGNPITEVCPASPGPQPTAAPAASPTAPTAPTAPAPTAPTSPAPTVAPVATPTATEAPSEMPSSVPTVSDNTDAPSALPTIAGSTAAPTAANTGTAAPTPAKATGTPTAAPAPGTSAPTSAAPVPAPPASCDDLLTVYTDCASANFADGQLTECNNCFTASFPSAGTVCDAAGICSALGTCPCEPCEDPLEAYTVCLFAQIGLDCDLNCTLTSPAPAAPTTDVPSGSPTGSAPPVAPSAAVPTATLAPTAAVTSDAPSDMPSGVPSSLSDAPSSTPTSVAPAAPTAAAPTAGVAPTAGTPTPPAPTAALTCTDILATYEACAAANFAAGQKTECEACVQASLSTSGVSCDAFAPIVCEAVYTTCNCSPCEAEFEGRVECAFAQAGFPCQFSCAR